MDAGGVDADNLTGLNISDKVRANVFQRARLGSGHPAGLAESAEAEGTEAVGVTDGIDGVLREQSQAVCALKAEHCRRNLLLPRYARKDGDELSDDL